MSKNLAENGFADCGRLGVKFDDPGVSPYVPG